MQSNRPQAYGLWYPASEPNNGYNLFIPAGKFRVTGNLDDLTAEGLAAGRRDGITIRGIPLKTIIIVDRGDGEYLFDSFLPAKIKSFFAIHFVDLCFSGGEDYLGGTSTASSFMRCWSDGQTGKFHSFENVKFYSLKKVMRTEGAVNADEMNFLNCRFYRIWENVLSLNNHESVAHVFTSCNASGNSCDAFFHVDAGGGGSIHWYGGSIINGFDLAENGKDSDQWLVHYEGSGHGNNRTVFTDVRFERRGIYSKLVKALYPALTCTQFNNCHWSGAHDVGTPRTVVELSWKNRVEFVNCGLGGFISTNDDYRYQFTNAFEDQRNPMRPSLLFDNCEMPIFDESHYIFVDDPIAGSVTARNCWNALQYDGTNDNNPTRAMDFHYPSAGAGRGATDASIETFMIALFRKGTHWPYTTELGNNEKHVILPPNAIILRIIIRKPAQLTETDAYQLHVGTNDKVTTYGSSVSAAYNVEHSIILNDQLIDVGTDLNTRTVRMWANATGGAIGHPDGFAFIEYI